MNLKISLLLATLSSYLAFGEEGVCTIEGGCEVNIYQQIWDADQALNGVPAILPSEITNPPQATGYVVTDEPSKGNNEDHRVHPNVCIPAEKRSTYDLVKKIFDNYTLNQKKQENPTTDEEKEEVRVFINAILELGPMALAKTFIQDQKGIDNMNETEWFDMIHKIWFDIYNFSDATPQRSGFEHVFVGELNGEKLGGYHFWYKYYLDDGGTNECNDSEEVEIYYDNPNDNIIYGETKYKNLVKEGVNNPEIVTAKYALNAIDFEDDSKTTFPLNKRIGGHFVGCSPEGLIALGLVAFHDPPDDKNVKKTIKTVINNQRYDLVLIKAGPGVNGTSSVNTFYPIFQGTVKFGDDDDDDKIGENDEENLAISSDGVRISAALINPDGADKGNETVTLINSSNTAIDITGWKIAGNNGIFSVLDNGNNINLDAGKTKTFRLRNDRDGAALKNPDSGKTATITLRDADNNDVDPVEYSKEDAKSGIEHVFK